MNISGLVEMIHEFKSQAQKMVDEKKITQAEMDEMMIKKNEFLQKVSGDKIISFPIEEVTSNVNQ